MPNGAPGPARTGPRPSLPLCALLCALLWLGSPAWPGAPARAAEEPAFSPEELEELVAPIALYPDELLAVALPASTYPLQIVQAARFLEKRKEDSDLEPDEDWDASVLGLLNYPEVVDRMNQDLDWTWKLGEAVAGQQPDVMDAVQRFRARVDSAGNLESNDKITVVKETQEEQQIIVIDSASPEVIYVPQYEPTVVVVHQPAPYPYYYSPPYPYYYHPRAAFWTGMFVGAAVGYGLHWGSGHRHGEIDIDRNVNINVDRSRHEHREARGDSGQRDSWKADPGRGRQSGGRPAGADRPGAGKRPATGARPSPGAGKTARDGGAAGRPTASKPGAGAKRPSSTPSRASSGRTLTTPSQGPSRTSSLGRYGSGSTTRAHSARGAASRGGSFSGGSRGGGRRR